MADLLTPGEKLQRPFSSTTATPASNSRKRKRDDTKSFLGVPFLIEPHNSAVFDVPIRITPTVLLPRSLIPLSWVTSGSSSRLFVASIPALDFPGNVLIAKYDTDRQLAAIERVSEGIFTLYRLSTHVKLKDVRILESKMKKSPVIPQAEMGMIIAGLDMVKAGGAEWWSAIRIDDLALDDACERRYETFPNAQVRLSSLLKSSKTSTIMTNTVRALPAPSESLTAVAEQAHSPTLPVEQSPLDVLNHVRKQYYETLYIAKTSLAYFAKSTLSRARVQFPSDGQAPQSRIDLVHFLQEMVNSIDRSDRKYKLSLPELAKNDIVEDESTFNDSEVVYAQRWLETIVGDDSPIRSAEQTGILLRKKIAELRTRETELQIILLLEILAIKVKLSTEKLDELAAKSQKKEKGAKAKKGKGKKKEKAVSVPDVSISLDLLVDRLCIWQSIGDDISPEEAAAGVEVEKGDHDHLRHFAVEVVMAFYSSRLPDECASIKRKFAGKTAQHIPVKRAESKAPKEPTPAPRPVAELPRRRISLARSNTAPATMLKSQGQDSLAAVITNNDSQDASKSQMANPPELLKKGPRGGLAASKGFGKRVIEIAPRASKLAKSDPKKKEKANEELKDAIKNISKPNRSAVSEEMLSASARRMKAGGNLRKAKNPIQRQPSSNVEVAATPRKNNRSNQFTDRKIVEPQETIVEEEHEPPSSNPIIPQSTVKPTARKRAHNVDVFDEGLSTPTKLPRFDRHKSALLPSRMLDSSPVAIPSSVNRRSISESFAAFSKTQQSRRNIVASTPTKPRTGNTPGGSEAFWVSAGFIGETPVKKTAGFVDETPVKKLRSKSISIINQEQEGGVKLVSEEGEEENADEANVYVKASYTKDLGVRQQEEVADEEEEGGVSIYEAMGWD